MPDYNTNAPQGNDIPEFSQQDFLDNFTILNDVFGENHVPFGNVITAAQRSTTDFPTVTLLTSPNHGLVQGDIITTSNTRGNYHGRQIPWGTFDGSVLFGPGPYVVNVDNPPVVDKVNTFTVTVDTSSFVVYQASQPGDFSVAGRFYGWHTQLNLPNPQSPSPPLSGPKSAFYTRIPGKSINPRLFFSNNKGEVQLTSLSNPDVFKETRAGIGIITPWGVTLNFGLVEFRSGGREYEFPIPYSSSSAIYSIIATPIKQVPTSTGFFSVEVTSRSTFKGYFLAAPINDRADCYYLAIGQ